MKPNLIKLLGISTPALCNKLPEVPEHLLLKAGALATEFVELLGQKNGFYAFERSLHVFPLGCKTSLIDLEEWNRNDSWKRGYEDIVINCLFFAEDAFGVQFGVYEERICKFDPETAAVETMSADFEEWAAKILTDYEYETGYGLAHEWQKLNGPIPKGRRLLPKIPFVLGGSYEVENLYAAEATRAMEFRADLWRQIRDLPDGAEIKLRVIDPSC